MRTITGVAWIGTCNKGLGTICVVTTNNGHTDKSYILAIELATRPDDDAIRTARFGNTIPNDVGEYLISKLGERCEITCPTN